MRSILVIALVLSSCSCEEDAESPQTTATAGGTTVAEQALLDTDGVLPAGGSVVEFELAVTAGTHLDVQLLSDAFDPVLGVQAPGAGALTNDDWQGSRAESRLTTMVGSTGTLKVSVTSFNPAASGTFHLRITNVAAIAPGTPSVASNLGIPVIQPVVTVTPGQPVEGELSTTDVVLADGRFSDTLVINGVAGQPLELAIDATTEAIPNAIILSPLGQAISPSNNGRYAIVHPGPHRVQLISGTPGQTAGYRLQLTVASGTPSTPTLGRSHHQLPTAAGTAALAPGQTLNGQLLANASALPTGEPATIYQLSGQAGQSIHLEMNSSAFDTYLMLISPNGQHWENDDSSGGTNSILDLTLPETGTYRVVATAYRSGMSGAFELKAANERGPVLVNAGNPTTAAADTQSGELAQGDDTLESGEFTDFYNFDFAAGERVRIDVHSSAFDTYLIVRPPSGDQADNDDANAPETDAGLDYVAQVAGTYRVQVTSYSAGETGAYDLIVSRSGAGAPTGNAGQNPTANPAAANPAANTPTPSAGAAATGTTQGGALAAGDEQLETGEFRDVFTRSFEPGTSVQIRLESTEFDPYLIVQSPSGNQSDNDDFNASTRNSRIDIPSAEPGEYQLLVTSYEPGETGAYNLVFGAGAAVPRANTGGSAPPTNGGVAASPDGAPRVFGIFAGITDYPDGVGDLPECANDAVKLAEALRNRGLLDPNRQILLTDAQATRGNILNGLQRFSREMGPSDVFIFFYSGHGGQTSSSNDPREIDGTDEYLVMYDGTLMDDQLATAFDTIQAGTSIIALDSCYSGGFAKDLITRPGRVGFFSSEEDVLSAVAGQFQAGGYLSHFLRTAVSGDADRSPRDGVLTVGELSHFLYTQFGTHATNIEVQGAFQHLVVDRGAVHGDRVLWAY